MRRATGIIVLVGLVLLMSATALADLKRMAANNCELEYDTEAGPFEYGIDRGGARIGAVNRTLGFVCPLLRAKTTNTNGLASLRVNFWKDDPTTFTCYAESYDQNGSPLKIVSRSTTTTGLTNLSWGTSLNVSSSRGTYGIICYAAGEVYPGDPDWGDEMYSIDYDEL